MIENLTTDIILTKQLPINELLDNSFYYPACGFDWGIIKFYGREIQSYFYCDYATGEEALLKHLNDFRGYKLLGHRPIRKEELIPNGWQMHLPPNFDIKQYYRYKQEFKIPFAHWAVYERMENFSEAHGPNRFSLIYIGGEGVATYQALYWSNKKTAKALAIIQPGTAFGLNWTNFSDRNGALAWVVLKNQYGKPDIIFYGGYGMGYNNFNWKDYKYERTISPYYSEGPFGEVTIWKRK
ncbi:hypothetical protein [Thermaurantimonas sp.]|uniref:hypothetical protein n=1 Tax=Thermaurantimonas sp. TaxID=2681568 RepID=UPI003919474F